MHQFYINDFLVDSEINFPCDPLAKPIQSSAHNRLSIRFAAPEVNHAVVKKLANDLAFKTHDGVLVDARDMRFHVTDCGTEITVSPQEDPPELNWVLHDAMAICYLRRGWLPLHGAAAQLGSRRFGILAPSGAGKSTLLWRLLEDGALFANDDLIPVYQSGAKPIAVPSVSIYPKVHRNSLEYWSTDWATLQPALPDTEEFFLPIDASQRVTSPVPLSALFLLSPSSTEADGCVRATRCLRSEAADVLRHNMHGIWLVEDLISPDALQEACAAVAAQPPVYRLSYRKTFDVMPVLTFAIKNLLGAAIADESVYGARLPLGVASRD